MFSQFTQTQLILVLDLGLGLPTDESEVILRLENGPDRDHNPHTIGIVLVDIREVGHEKIMDGAGHDRLPGQGLGSALASMVAVRGSTVRAVHRSMDRLASTQILRSLFGQWR